MDGFINWATIAGGFSGFLSFIYVAYEKISSGPKVVSTIASATVHEIMPTQSDLWFNYDFVIEVEIGNIGTKLTSILKPQLEIREISKKYELFFSDETDSPLRIANRPSIALEAGFANSYTLRCNYRCEKRIETASFTGRLKLKEIMGKFTQHNLVFNKI